MDLNPLHRSSLSNSSIEWCGVLQIGLLAGTFELVHGPGWADGTLKPLDDATQLKEFNGPINEAENAIININSSIIIFVQKCDSVRIHRCIYSRVVIVFDEELIGAALLVIVLNNIPSRNS